MNETTGTSEHRHVGGSAGGPGQNSVECACGLLFDGFGTHATAMEFLDRHIANETGTEPCTTKPTKPAADLTPGDLIWHSGQIREVRHVEPYGRDDKPLYLVVLAGGGRFDATGDYEAQIATDDEIAEIEAAGRREALANALHDLAHAIVTKALPLPKYRAEFVLVADDRATVDRWAEHFGVEVQMGGTDENIPVIKPLLPGNLLVRAQAPSEPVEPKPAPELVVEFARPVGYASDIEQDERDALTAPEPEHRHTRGWKGDEPGSCGVECACGLTYDGFDSLAEAAEHLDRHIAKAEAEAAQS